MWSAPPALPISTAHHWYSFPAPNSPHYVFLFFPLLAPLLSLDRGLWVKRRGECSITTRSDPIKYRFNQPSGRPVNTQSDQAAAATGEPGSVGATLHIHQAEGIDSVGEGGWGGRLDPI